MSLPQLSYPQYLSATQAVHGCDRSGVLAASARGNGAEIGANTSATTAAVTSVLGMYNHYSAHNYSAFLPYTRADLALFSQLGSQYEFKDSPGVHPASFAAHPSTAFYPYGQYQYGDPSRAKSATRESTSTLKAWLQEHKKNPYPTKGEKIMLAIITKMTLTQVSTWFANARRRLKKENKVTWGRSAEDRDGKIFDSDTEGDAEKNEDDEEIDLESIDIDKVDENSGDQSNEEDDDGKGHQQHDHHRRKQQTPTSGVTSSATEAHSENCPDEFTPKHIDRQMTESPTPTLKSPFQLVNDSSRNQQEATQRVLMALSST
ncbi:hypothetical protein AGOR_G00039190 [Albula goreensis]|uniref:Homeobox domain-containing protein n=1 Tax=Albula goreensis TaxID=1534307 RepID=A0A8T3DZS5_9TELE|nr:hypothetical protein AGOR_G00039190 [Albula goreensis]